MNDIYKKITRKRKTLWLYTTTIKKLKQMRKSTRLSQAKILENLIIERFNKSNK